MSGVVLMAGRRHFGIRSMAEQLVRELGLGTVDVSALSPAEVAERCRGRLVVSPMLDGVLPDYRDAVRAASDAGRFAWVPMSEYLLPEGAVRYRGFPRVLSPTRQAQVWLDARGVASDLVPWWTEPSDTRPREGSAQHILHFSYGDLGQSKSGTDLVFGAWPQLQAMGYTLTVKSRTPIAVPEGVSLNHNDDDADAMERLWGGHGILLQPYRRCGIGLPPVEAAGRGLVALVSERTAAAEFVPEPWRLPSVPDVRRPDDEAWEARAGGVRDWERSTTPEAIVAAFRQMDRLRDHVAEATETAQAGFRAWQEAWGAAL